MTTFLLAVQVIGMALVFGYIIYMVMNKITGEYSVLTAALVSSFINCFAYTMYMTSDGKSEALAVKPFDIMGSALALYLLYCFVQYLCGLRIHKAVNAALLTADMLGIAAAASDSSLHLYYKSFEQVPNEDIFAADVTYAAGFFPLMISMFIQLAVIVAGTIYCLMKRKASVSRIALSFLTVILPLASMFAYSAKLFGYYNPSSIAMCISCAAIAFSVHHGIKLDVVNSARDSVIESMDDALIVTDDKMNIVDSNPAARRIFPAIAYGKKADAAKLAAELAGGEDNAEFELDGKYYKKHVKRLLNADGSGRGYSVLLIDSTETKKYVDQLIEMRRKADMANSAKSDFLANMSHEIRTPMNAITGFAELCLREKNYVYAADIKTASKNLISIINDILDISKIEAGKLELVQSVYDTETMLDDIVGMIFIQLDKKKNIEFKVDIDNRLPKKMYGDEVRLKQILINLLGNAVKFTKSGYISFSVKEINRVRDEISLIFRVTDTGIGIKKEDIPKLFDNFQQMDTRKNREIEGSGLGLSISKTLAEMMNGNITVDSEYGKGSSFMAVITQKISDPSPISKNTAKTAAAEESEFMPYAPEAHVLVVDDNKVNLNVTAQLLHMYGITAELADSGKKAVEKINSAYYDLVFMDHMMPELDGVDTTKMIRAQGDAYSRGLPIVALTANAISGAREMFMEAGFNDFISKPIQIPLLEKILETWLPEQMVKLVERNKKQSLKNGAGVTDIFGAEPPQQENALAEEDEILIPNVDVQAGLSFYGGSAEAYLAVLKTFMETADESISKIENYAQNRDYKNYITEVHGLKSSSMAIGANSLSEMARKLEEAGKNEDYKQIQQDTPVLIARFSEIAEHIKPFVETEKKDADSKPPADPKALEAELNDVLEAIDDLNSHSAMEILDKLMEYRYDNSDIGNEIESSRRYVDNYAYEKAEASVKRALELIGAAKH